MAAPILNKIKAIAAAAVVSAVGAAGVTLTTKVDWQTAFGPTWGLIAATGIGFAVKEGLPVIIDYIKTLGEVDSVEVDGEEV